MTPPNTGNVRAPNTAPVPLQLVQPPRPTHTSASREPTPENYAIATPRPSAWGTPSDRNSDTSQYVVIPSTWGDAEAWTHQPLLGSASAGGQMPNALTLGQGHTTLKHACRMDGRPYYLTLVQSAT